MRSIILFLFASLAIFGSATHAQYPYNETISPYPKQIKERTLRQRFVCDAQNNTNWKALHDSLLTPLNDSLKVESNGSDPYIMLPKIEKPRTGTFEFRIRMKNKMLPGAEIFWTTTKQGTCAENAAQFRFVPDGEWYTYTKEFTTADPLTGLRFDPGGSIGVAEIEWVELYDVVYENESPKHPDWIDPYWTASVANWKMIASDNIKIKFDDKGTGAVVFLDDKAVGEIYPLAYVDQRLPLGGVKGIPFYREEKGPTGGKSEPIFWAISDTSESTIAFTAPPIAGMLKFSLKNDELRFELKSSENVFGPVFRPFGEMEQAILNGVEYLEKGEHSSSTADIETAEHIRFAPNPLDVTWPFMSVVTEKVGFGLYWDDSSVQAIFATPDFLFGDSTKHHLGLYGKQFAGTLKLIKSRGDQPTESLTDLDMLTLWAFKKNGLPELPKRPHNDEEQRLLNLAGFEKSIAVGPNGTGWMHAAVPNAAKQHFPTSFGSDYVTSIWQLTGKLPNVPKLDAGGAHLQNPAAYFLTDRAEVFRVWKRNEAKLFRDQQRPDGSFSYNGKYLKGHWEDTASGHCGNALFRLLYSYRILGEPESLAAALKGLEFANKYSVPRGAQVWELSLHTPDIMGSSRMCMSNVWAFEATGETKYLDAARRWAITGLPFVYFWEQKPLGGTDKPIMLFATTPVLGATNWVAPNWIGLPVQWCGLDFGEACFMLSKHDQTLDWKKIAEGILIAAEQMQYPDGPSIGLLPDSFNLSMQKRNPADINPTVLVMQRRLLQGKLESIDVALSADGKFRVVSPFRTKIETAVGKPTAVIEGVSGTKYQIIVNGKEIKTIESKGIDRVELP